MTFTARVREIVRVGVKKLRRRRLGQGLGMQLVFEIGHCQIPKELSRGSLAVSSEKRLECQGESAIPKEGEGAGCGRVRA